MRVVAAVIADSYVGFPADCSMPSTTPSCGTARHGQSDRRHAVAGTKHIHHVPPQRRMRPRLHTWDLCQQPETATPDDARTRAPADSRLFRCADRCFSLGSTFIDLPAK